MLERAVQQHGALDGPDLGPGGALAWIALVQARTLVGEKAGGRDAAARAAHPRGARAIGSAASSGAAVGVGTATGGPDGCTRQRAAGRSVHFALTAPATPGGLSYSRAGRRLSFSRRISFESQKLGITRSAPRALVFAPR